MTPRPVAAVVVFVSLVFPSSVLPSTVLALAGGAAAQDAGGAAPPNLVVFLVDDLGWQDVSLPLHTEPTAWNARYRTPNVERLAARGLAFTNAYASAPVCTPSRTSLHTGRSPAANAITYWTLHADQDTSARWEGLLPPRWNVNGLQPGDVTLPALLQAAGYRTIHVGKAHLGAVGTAGGDPTNLGFDVNVAGHGAGAPGSYLGARDFRSEPDGEPRVWDVPGLEASHGRDVFLTDVLAEEAVAAVEEVAAAGVPFFLHFAPYAVHTPIIAHPERVQAYGDLDPKEAAYASLVESADAALGRVLDTLDALELTDDTIVVFSSDNGGLSAVARGGEAHTHNTPLHSGKGSFHEGGTRVPQVIAWPGVTDGGGRTDVPVVTHDLFPTLLGLAGVGVPDEHPVEGVDLAPLLRGGALPERDLFWHQPHFWGPRGPGIQPFSSVRSGDWKLVYRHADRGFELYDLAGDLGETTDRVDDEPERAAELAARLDAWLSAVDAGLSVDEATGEVIPGPAAAWVAWSAR